MNEIELKRLIDIVLSICPATALFVNCNMSIESVKALNQLIQEMTIVSDQMFFKKAILARIRNGVTVVSVQEVMQLFAGKNVDMIVCRSITEHVIVLAKKFSVKHVYSIEPFAGDDEYLNQNGLFRLNQFMFTTTQPVSALKAAGDTIIKSKKCSFAVVNYNTSKLINILINSIKKFVKSFDYDIWIFDNSDKEKLTIDAKDSFIHVIDNTKGQIIDYEDAIHKYCNYKNKKYLEIFAGFISMKHCMALQKLIDDNRLSDDIIICDSDVIIKKDLDFIDSKYASIGNVEIKNDSLAKPRILPYLCYVNRRKLMEFDLKYFDNYRCHGCILKNNDVFPSYDTGAAFYEDILKKCNGLFKQINIDDYMYHLGGMSRTDKYRRTKYNEGGIEDIIVSLGLDKPIEAPSISNSKIRRLDFNTFTSQKYESVSKAFSVKPRHDYVIYTSITGKYDALKMQSFYQSDLFDYVCFTDADLKADGNWIVVDISSLKDILGIHDECRLARFVKTHPHLFFKDYKMSIWIDGNIDAKGGNAVDLIKAFADDDYIMMKKHPAVDNVMAEISKCKAMKKDDPKLLDAMKTFLQIENFNDKGWHIESNVIVRAHNNPKCVELMEHWWNMIRDHSKRDQVSFNYIMQRYEGKLLIIDNEEMNKYFSTDYKHS